MKNFIILLALLSQSAFAADLVQSIKKDASGNVVIMFKGDDSTPSKIPAFTTSGVLQIVDGSINQLEITGTGSQNAPTIRFTTANSGIYETGTGVGITASGNLKMIVNNDQIEIDGGTAAVPGLAIAGDDNTGMFSDAGDVLSFSTAGVERGSWNGNGLGIGRDAATGEQLSIQNAAPTIGFWDSSNSEEATFVWNNSDIAINMVTDLTATQVPNFDINMGGNLSLRLTATSTAMTNFTLLGPDDGIYFLGDSDTGIKLGAVGVLDLVVGGVTKGQITSSGINGSGLIDGSVTEGKIAQDTLDDTEIQDNSLTSASLAANSVGASELDNTATFTMAAWNVGQDTLTTYDFGTWSHNTTVSATNVTGGTITSRSGTFVRVGRQVTLTYTFTADPTASPFSFSFNQEDLPVNPDATDRFVGVCFRVATARSDTNYGSWFGDPNDSGDIEVWFTTSNLGAAGYACSVSYVAASD